jgi:hypothetical protein
MMTGRMRDPSPSLSIAFNMGGRLRPLQIMVRSVI